MKNYNAETGLLNFERTVYESTFTGGVRVATADFDQDGYPDLVVGPGASGGPRVRVLNGKTGEEIAGPLGNFFAFEESFTGGVEVAAADVTGDNVPDLIVAAGRGGGPHVRVFDGKSGKAIMNFMAFDPNFRGGVSIAAADFTQDGRSDLVIGAGPGGGPHVKIYDFTTGTVIPGPLGNFFAYESEYRGGVHVGTDWKTGDFTGDGRADLVVGPGADHTPDVKVFSGSTGTLERTISAFDSTMTAGVRVGLSYITDDEFADVVVATEVGAVNEVRVYDTVTGTQLPGGLGKYTPFGLMNTNGVTLATSNDPPGGGGGSPPPPPPPPPLPPPPSNQGTYYNLRLDKSFPDSALIQATPPYNIYTIHEVADYTPDHTRIHWDVTVTNQSIPTELTHEMADDGIAYFTIPTHIVTGVTIISTTGWTGNVNPISAGSEDGNLVWTVNSDTYRIFVDGSKTFSFETPIVVVQGGDTTGATYPPVNGGFLYEAVTNCQAALPGSPKPLPFDLDIDSNNNNGFGLPEHSAWEEELESSNYGLGKLIVQSSDINSIGNNSTPYTPLVLTISPNLDVLNQDWKIQFDYQTNNPRAGGIRI